MLTCIQNYHSCCCLNHNYGFHHPNTNRLASCHHALFMSHRFKWTLLFLTRLCSPPPSREVFGSLPPPGFAPRRRLIRTSSHWLIAVDWGSEQISGICTSLCFTVSSPSRCSGAESLTLAVLVSSSCMIFNSVIKKFPSQKALERRDDDGDEDLWRVCSVTPSASVFVFWASAD